MKISIDSATEIITVDGVQISLALLKSVANPEPDFIYTMVRKGDVVWMNKLSPQGLAQA